MNNIMSKSKIDALEVSCLKAMLIEVSEQNTKLISFLEMAACYACVEGSEEEEAFTESLLEEFGLNDK